MSTQDETATNEASVSPETEALLARLRRIEGQIRGIHRMVEEDRVCQDVLTQLMAARSGLDQVGLLLLDQHVERCLGGAPADEAMKELQSALRMWMRFSPASPSE